jgi:hypothetical protein
LPFDAAPLASIAFGPRGIVGALVFLALVLAALEFARRSYRNTEPALEAGPRRLLTTLRALALLLIVIMLAEPVLHRSHEVVTPPGVVVLVDDSASMSIRGGDGTSRAEAADTLAEDLVQRFSERREEPRIWLERGARRVESSAERGRDPLSDASADGEGTDLAGLVLSSAQRHLEDNLEAVLLISDGRTTTDRGPGLAGLDVPVWAIAVGDSAGPLDLRLDRVRYPTYVHQGDRVRIDAEVVADGSRPGSAVVRLERGGAVVDTVDVSWPRDGGRVPVHFEVEADSLGLRHYAVEIEAGSGETVQRNNRVQVGFEVGKDRLRVLYLERSPSWNAHFLARYAARDRRLEWIGVHAAVDGLRIAGTDSTLTWPMSEEQLLDVDLFVAGSLDDASFLVSDASGVATAVRSGAGLLVLAGDGARIRRPGPQVESLLALRPEPRSRWMQGNLRAEITAAGRIHPVLSVEPELGDLSTWLRTVPPLRAALLPVQVAPDADVLLRGVGERFSTPLLAVREEGEGRVATINGAPLWSWSFWRLGDDESEPLYRAWIGNLVAFLAEGGDRERLRLQLPGPVVAQGDDVELRALALDSRLRPDESSDVWLEWAAGDADSLDARSEVLGRARMRDDPRTPGGRRLAVPALPPGSYGVRVALEDADGTLVSDWQSLTVDPYSVEFRDPDVDAASLASLARRTGGELLRADGARGWAAELPLERRESVLAGRLDLWASPWLLVPLLALLGLEWGLRKRWGLI